MRRISFTFVAILLLQGIVLAQTPEPQPEWLTRQATIQAKGTLAILKAVQEVGGFALEVSAEDEKSLDEEFSWKFTGARIKDILGFILRRAGLSYRIIDEKTVQVVKPTPTP